MPAVTFMHRMSHSSQNCGVREAALTVHLVGGDQGRSRCLGNPSLRLPSLPRHANGKDAKHHEDEVEQAHRHPGGRDGMRGRLVKHHQLGPQRRTDHRPSAEAHDRETGSQSRPVGKPLDQRRDG